MKKKILVRAPQWLGDAVVSTIFLERLRRLNADGEIHVLCPPALRSLFEACPAVTAVMTLPYGSGGTVFQVGRHIRAGRFDEMYILPRSLRSWLEAFLGGVPNRIRFGRKIPYDAMLLYPHRYLKLIGEEKLAPSEFKPFFPKSDETAWLTSAQKPILGLAPASIAPARTWDTKRFAQVADLFLKKYRGTVVLFGSSSEKAICSALKEAIAGPVIDTSGQLDLPPLGALISRCDAFLANDSGLMHVAAAFNIPTVAVFGASDPHTALPANGKVKAIQNNKVPCVPCHRNYCPRFGMFNRECLTSIQVEEVFAALEESI